MDIKRRDWSVSRSLMTDDSLFDRVMSYMKDNKITLIKFAKMLGMSMGALRSMIESGRIKSLKSYYKVEKFLKEKE